MSSKYMKEVYNYPPSAKEICEQIVKKLKCVQLSKDGILQQKKAIQTKEVPALTSDEVALVGHAIDKSLHVVDDSFKDAIKLNTLEHFSTRYFASYNFTKALTLSILNEMKKHRI